MERLTTRDDKGVAFWADKRCAGGGYRMTENAQDLKRLDRLAAYEDTGLEPGEVKEHEATYIETMTRTYGPFHQKISQWLQAEKDGWLVVLPCKVGDTAYRVIRRKDGHGHIANATVSCLHMGDTARNRRYKKGKEYIVLKVDGNFCAHVDREQIGKTVFLTREEAEAALKKREED